MRPFKHFVVSTISGAVVYSLTGALSPSIACFLTGWLIDVDHFYDYIKVNGWNFSVKGFFEHFDRSLNLTLSFATLGYIIHLLSDQFTNGVSPLAYFLTYRVAKGFDKWSVLNTNRQ
ncbi:MAG: hypothetical protein HYW14_02410 [Planctomycetes bacterium]|nr:hypothetical protein [Planctomycetota bacterium]